MLEDIFLVVVALRLAVCLCQQICADFSVATNSQRRTLHVRSPAIFVCTEPREVFFLAVVFCTIQYARRRLWVLVGIVTRSPSCSH